MRRLQACVFGHMRSCCAALVGYAAGMTSIGYFLSSEEHPGSELVRAAGLAERAGFEALWISDHFHPPLRSCSAETAAAPERP
jgi:hypothetical protein